MHKKGWLCGLLVLMMVMTIGLPQGAAAQTKRDYSKLKGLWISDAVMENQSMVEGIERRELIQFAHDKNKSFAVSSLSGYHTKNFSSSSKLKSFKQPTANSYELVYELTHIPDGYFATSENRSPMVEECKTTIRWIDDHTIELMNYPLSTFNDNVDENGERISPKPQRYTRVSKAYLFSNGEMALEPMYSDYRSYDFDAFGNLKKISPKKVWQGLSVEDKQILNAIEKDYKAIYKNKGKYKDIKMEVLVALEAIAG